jgi:hypothetical protein
MSASRRRADSAVEEAHALGIETTDDLEAAMAIRIMAAIEDGEYDVEQLKRWALHEVDRKRFSAPTNRPHHTRQFINRQASFRSLDAARRQVLELYRKNMRAK